jgi:hypothetical protein
MPFPVPWWVLPASPQSDRHNHSAACTRALHLLRRCLPAASPALNHRCRPPLCAGSPQDYLFDPAKYSDDPGSHGTALEVREASMLANERAPAQIKASSADSSCFEGAVLGQRCLLGLCTDAAGLGNRGVLSAVPAGETPGSSREQACRLHSLSCCSFVSFCSPAPLDGRAQDSVLIIQPSASLECAACVEEAAAADGTLLLRVPPALRDDALLPLLEPYSSYRVWRLSLAGVGSARRAFGGFASREAASQLDARVEWMTTEFCCRCGPNLLPPLPARDAEPALGSPHAPRWSAAVLQPYCAARVLALHRPSQRLALRSGQVLVRQAAPASWLAPLPSALLPVCVFV